MKQIISLIAGLGLFASNFVFAQEQILVSTGVNTTSGCAVSVGKAYSEQQVVSTAELRNMEILGRPFSNVSGLSSSIDMFEAPEFQCSAGSTITVSHPSGGVFDSTIGGFPARITYGYQIYTGASYESSPIAQGLFSEGGATFVSNGEKTKINIFAILTSPSDKSFPGGWSLTDWFYLDIAFSD